MGPEDTRSGGEYFQEGGTAKNLGKNKTMVFTLDLLWVKLGSEACNRRSTEEGDTLREQKETRVSLEEYGWEVEVPSLCQHIEREHMLVLPQTWGGKT